MPITGLLPNVFCIFLCESLVPSCIVVGRAGHTHAVIDQRFSRISVRLRQEDAYTPHDLNRVLADLFARSEEVGSELIMLPGWDGLEDTDTIANGPGDFKSVFDPDAPGSHLRKFSGFGTSRGSGRRIHSFKISRDADGAPVICSREHDVFGDYSDGLRVFKGSGLHPVVESIPGVQLEASDDHDLVLQKAKYLEQILLRFGSGEDTAAAVALQADIVQKYRKDAGLTGQYWTSYDSKVAEITSTPDARARFEFRALPVLHKGKLEDEVAGWLEALEDSAVASALCLANYSRAPGRASPSKGTVEATYEALQTAAETQDNSFQDRQEFVHLPAKELHVPGTAGHVADATFDPTTIAVGDIVLVRVNPDDVGQEGRPWAVGVALHRATKDHSAQHKKGSVPAVFQEEEASISAGTDMSLIWMLLHVDFVLHASLGASQECNEACACLTVTVAAVVAAAAGCRHRRGLAGAD